MQINVKIIWFIRILLKGSSKLQTSEGERGEKDRAGKVGKVKKTFKKHENSTWNIEIHVNIGHEKFANKKSVFLSLSFSKNCL